MVSQPTLTLVPRRKRAARVVVVASSMVVLSMLGAAAFQTQLAGRQLEIDRLDRDIAASRSGYDVLRRERAELRSPGRLAEVAASTGMVAADESVYVMITPEVKALVRQSTGSIDPASLGTNDALLDQFRDVKAATDGAP